MKIKKSSIQSCDSLLNTANVSTSELNTISNQCCPYDEAKNYIQSAISALSSIAKDDVVAKESIANLAVVLMDLQ